MKEWHEISKEFKKQMEEFEIFQDKDVNLLKRLMDDSSRDNFESMPHWDNKVYKGFKSRNFRRNMEYYLYSLNLVLLEEEHA